MAEIFTYSGIAILVDDFVMEEEVAPGLKVKEARWLMVNKRSEGRKSPYPYTNPIMPDGSRKWKSLMSIVCPNSPGAKLIFKNGNDHDFRRENIQPVYRGFRLKKERGDGGSTIQISHCPFHYHGIKSAPEGQKHEQCDKCNIQDMHRATFWYDRCLDLAADKGWPGWTVVQAPDVTLTQ